MSGFISAEATGFGIPATIALLFTAWVLIGRREGQPVLARTRQLAWVTSCLLAAASLALASGTRRAGGLGLRKLARRIRATLPGGGPQAAPERPLPPRPYQPQHRRPATGAAR